LLPCQAYGLTAGKGWVFSVADVSAGHEVLPGVREKCLEKVQELKLDDARAAQTGKVNAFQGGDLVDQFIHLRGLPFEDNGFQTSVVIYMDMGAAEHMHQMVVLDLNQFFSQASLVMVKHQSQYADNVFHAVVPLLIDYPVAKQIADILGAGLIATLAAVSFYLFK
jgi:hypothetical protein